MKHAEQPPGCAVQLEIPTRDAAGAQLLSTKSRLNAATTDVRCIFRVVAPFLASTNTRGNRPGRQHGLSSGFWLAVPAGLSQKTVESTGTVEVTPDYRSRVIDLGRSRRIGAGEVDDKETAFGTKITMLREVGIDCRANQVLAVANAGCVRLLFPRHINLLDRVAIQNKAVQVEAGVGKVTYDLAAIVYAERLSFRK